jgi:DUF4097 and DUF4098 domain-containing protein YvlB
LLAFVLGFVIRKKKMQMEEYYNQDFMYSDEVLWQKKRRIQKERWYQRERNKEISFLKKETNSISRIPGEMQQEIDVLMTFVNAQQVSELDVLPSSKVVGDYCWQEKNFKGFKKKL